MSNTTDLCDDCEKRESLPGISRCRHCVNSQLPNQFELPEDARERAEDHYENTGSNQYGEQL